ncbi:MAG: bifunctional riboflavin kinase/FAD synthetase [Anaerolineales bacterium]|nr:bifunctional riboflavin kinase/FAD synthetase [Anaerolineales bacterium]GJQ34464.1 MAG: riboflavin biosynthesis protein [Anaerolineaceae bacterium]
MQHHRFLEELTLKNSYLTVGVFDGVHRGHREIIHKLVRDAHMNNAPAVVLTFEPHPASVLTGREIRCLTTSDERADLLFSLGVDTVITQRFTPDLSAVPAHEYMSRLKSHLGLSHLLVGYDFALGRGREGNAPRLTEIGLELGYTVEVVPALGDESGVISSTEIRKLVSIGDMAEAAKLLGYRYRMGGEVIHGEGRGKKLNFPTANIDYPKQKAIPPNGIYACWARLGDERYMAATNIGLNPTFTPERKIPSLEAYLLDFDRDIYGEILTLEFVARLRDEIRYTNVEALIEQIHEDVKQTRVLLSAEI